MSGLVPLPASLQGSMSGLSGGLNVSVDRYINKIRKKERAIAFGNTPRGFVDEEGYEKKDEKRSG